MAHDRAAPQRDARRQPAGVRGVAPRPPPLRLRNGLSLRHRQRPRNARRTHRSGLALALATARGSRRCAPPRRARIERRGARDRRVPRGRLRALSPHAGSARVADETAASAATSLRDRVERRARTRRSAPRPHRVPRASAARVATQRVAIGGARGTDRSHPRTDRSLSKSSGIAEAPSVRRTESIPSQVQHEARCAGRVPVGPRGARERELDAPARSKVAAAVTAEAEVAADVGVPRGSERERERRTAA